MKKKVVIVDYGIGNILSLKMAFNEIDLEVVYSKDEKEILDSKYIILPGVGAFKKAMDKIKVYKIDQILKQSVKNKSLILGICLGAQLLFSKSNEFGETYGLGLIDGEVKSISEEKNFKVNDTKLPHIGWSEINKEKDLKKNQKSLLDNITDEDNFYFVHSYICHVKNNFNKIAMTNYGNLSIPAIVGSENIFGCQFHPEKSGKSGLKLLKNFTNLS